MLTSQKRRPSPNSDSPAALASPPSAAIRPIARGLHLLACPHDRAIFVTSSCNACPGAFSAHFGSGDRADLIDNGAGSL